ncbi:MAG: cupin domain-containing protein [Saprospiraceae bacterium]|nr:cupin domain-containing protein [Saprospiraceae bacterium]
MENTHAQPETGIAIQLTDQLDFRPEKFNSKVLFREEGFSLTLFALLEGQEIPEHKTPRNAYLQCLEGEATVTIGGIPRTLKKGDIVLMPKEVMHGVRVSKKTKLMLLK